MINKKVYWYPEEKMKNRKKPIILYCDFSYNLFKHEYIDPVKEFLNTMFSNLV